MQLRTQLPLWEQWAPRVTPEDYGPGCTKCSRGTHAELETDLLAAQQQLSGVVDTLIVVGEPTLEEQERGKPFVSATHRQVVRQALMATAESGDSYALAYAIKCHGSGSKKDNLGSVDACRPHLHSQLLASGAKRIVSIGPIASRSIVGKYVDILRLRRAWTIVNGVPVFLVMDTAEMFRNRFNQRAYEDDFQWAMNAPLPVVPQGFTRVLTKPEEVEHYLDTLDRDLPVAIDVEHDGTLWGPGFKLLCLGLCQDPEHPVVLTYSAVMLSRKRLSAWLSDATWPKLNQNIKHDRHAMYRVLGVDIAGIVSDTMLISRLREPEAPAGLGPQSWLVGFGGYKEAAKATVAADGEDDAKGGALFAKMPPDDLHAYNGRDGAATILVHRWQERNKSRTKVTWERLIGPAFDALAIVERNGMLVSGDNVRAYDALLAAREAKASVELYAHPMVPPGFNPGSPVQVADLLYKKLRLPVLGKTKIGAPSTAKDVLALLVGEHPIVSVLLELSIVRKQRNTYGLAMLDHVSPIDGRIHTTFKLVRTLRLSSSEPNMQNVTTPEQDGDEGSWARGCFIAPPGHKLVNFDYGQMELRVAAMLSGDTVMAKAFEQGHDYHTVTAALIFNCPPEAVTKEQRRIAKSINFGLIYGQSAYGLSKALDISQQKAQGYIDALFSRLTRLNTWRSTQIAQAKVHGVLVTKWDPPGGNLGWMLRRSVAGIGAVGSSKEAERLRKHNENIALNSPIQGVANLFSLASLAELVRWTQDEQPRIKVIMTVHDSIVLECPDELIDLAVDEAKTTMLKWPSGVVKFHVDVEIGQDWGHMVKYVSEKSVAST